MSKCSLCGVEGIKLAKSHIIPKSLYAEGLKSDKGPAKIINNTEGEYPKRSPNGVYDDSILCLECEASFSDWDDYAHQLFIETALSPLRPVGGKPLAGEHKEIEQLKLQMFFISLIWRMHVTKHEMFQALNLGPYKGKVKEALANSDPSLVPELDVIVSKFDSDLSVAFLGPSKLRIDGVNGYRVGFARHLCWVKIDKRDFPEKFRVMALSNGAPFRILYREFDGSPEKQAIIETVKGIKK